jgi:alpha-glucosidase
VYGGHPSSLLSSPAAEVIRAIPSVWDETRVLPPSAIGELAVFARRRGATWFLAVLNGPEARALRVPLSFLGGGAYEATLVRDVEADPAAMTVERATLTRASEVAVDLRSGGGFVARLVPARRR